MALQPSSRKSTTATLVKLSPKRMWALLHGLAKASGNPYPGPGFILHFKAEGIWELAGTGLKNRKTYFVGPGEYTLTFHSHSSNLGEVELQMIDPDPGGTKNPNALL